MLKLFKCLNSIYLIGTISLKSKKKYQIERQMKTKYLRFIFLILFVNCSDSKEERFLNNFIDKEKINSNFDYKKEINKEDFYILNKTEALNELDSNKFFYYGYKTKLDNDCYLIFYSTQYYIDNNFHPFAMGLASKGYLCIYQKGVGIVSKLKISSNDPNLIHFEEKNEIYIIKSLSSYLKYDEGKNGFYPYLEKDTIVSKYKIENKRFVEIKTEK